MTLGPLLDHTAAKHDILRFHLQAWFPILGQAFRRSSLQYIDGFCGPGEYEGGEDGSPILALKEMRAHSYLEEFIEAHRHLKFIFIDKDDVAIDNLNSKLSAVSWPVAFDILVKRGLFDVELGKILDGVDRGEREMPPSLILIDPFGPSGFPLDLLKRLAAHPQVDVLINLNYSAFNRWILPNPALHSVADGIYGGPRWRPSLDLSETDRPEFLVKEYEDALGEIGWRGTNFEMINANNQTQYYLVFGTGSPKGMEVIKRAMRNASPDGAFRYSDRSNREQPVMLGMHMEEEYQKRVAEFLLAKYDEQEVRMKKIIDEDVAWHPHWLVGDLRAALRQLEDESPSRIAEVSRPGGLTRRRRNFPDDCVIRFGKTGQIALL